MKRSGLKLRASDQNHQAAAIVNYTAKRIRSAGVPPGVVENNVPPGVELRSDGICDAS